MQGVPIRIAYSHTTRDEYPKAVSRLVYKKIMRSLILKHATHCLGCCSNAAAALFGAEWERNPKCGVLYTSVNVDNYQPNQPQNVFKSDFSIPENSPVIGHVGSFRMAKNHDFFLDIALEIHKQRPDIYFFFAGDGPLRSEMEKKAEKIGIRKQVIFAGNRKDVPQLLMFIFDLLLFPSIYEGMPLTLVEATAAGVPIVCSDVICQEATNVCPEHIVRLPLSVGPEIWAKHTLATLENKVDFSKEAFDKMSKSHFSDQYSLEQLMKIYNQAVH
jgi:glycosyltransferase EpsF